MNPFRAIASLELLGTMLGLMLLVDETFSSERYFACSLSVGGITDNNGNRYAVTKMLTAKWPLLAFLAELSLQLESRGILLEVNWVRENRIRRRTRDHEWRLYLA